MFGRKLERGYTLVEILIVVSIISVLVTFGISAYAKARDRQTIQAAKEAIITVLQNAQKSALIGEKDCSDALTGIEVTFSGTNVRTQARCTGGNGTRVDHPISGVNFTSNPTILFKPLGQGINGTNFNINYTISGKTYRVRVESPGTIHYVGEV